jgi:hypothetical protein
MTRKLSVLLAGVFATIALAVAGTASAASSQVRGTIGTVQPAGCGLVHRVNVDAATRITATAAGTNVSGTLMTEILGPGNDVRVFDGSYTAPSAGVYGVRVCFLSDGIDEAPIQYVALVTIG